MGDHSRDQIEYDVSGWMLDGVVGWVDFSQDERNRVDKVLSAFRGQGTLDELGFGRIRDSFSDLLAPGVSTLHTRVRYYLFVPWIFQKLEAKQVPASDFEQRLRRLEVRLIDALHRGEGEEGIIGTESREDLNRFPSDIYWNGMRVWDILRFDGSKNEYLRNIGSMYDHQDTPSESGGSSAALWHRGIPDAPPKFLEETSFALRTEEAKYLIDRIQTRLSTPPTLLSLLTRPGRISSISDIEKPWNRRLLSEAPESLESTLRHARNFARLTRGANLTYNLHLAAKRGVESVEADMKEELQKWMSSVHGDWKETLSSWNWGDLREVLSKAAGHSINFESTVLDFLDRWRRHVLQATRVGDFESSRACNLIRRREHQVKGPRARLSNRSALENWNGRPSGTGLQTYRWDQVRRFATDIATPIDL